MRNEWMECQDINRNDDERQSLVKDKLWYDEVMEPRENVKCAICSSYVYRKDSKRVDNITACNECITKHGLNVEQR